jgi:hypothetical protein
MQKVIMADYPQGDYICPITGSKLIFQVPKEVKDDDGLLSWMEPSPTPRDSGFHYVSETNHNIGFRVSPFDYNKFWIDYELPFDNLPSIYGPDAISREDYKKLWEAADRFSKSLKAFGKYKRVFIYNNGVWEEKIWVAFKYLPSNSTLEEILQVIKEDEDEYQRKLADSIQNPEKYPLGFARRVVAKTFENTPREEVKVQPMGPPLGILHYIDYETKS